VRCGVKVISTRSFIGGDANYSFAFFIAIKGRIPQTDVENNILQLTEKVKKEARLMAGLNIFKNLVKKERKSFKLLCRLGL